MRRCSVLAGVGGIAFSVLNVVAFFMASPPGGTYTESEAVDYVTPEHLPTVLIAEALALLGVVGLICLLAYLREAISVVPNHHLAASIFWGTGVAAVTSFAVGWGLLAGQPWAHALGGGAIVTTPPMTYLLSEIGAGIIFGPGATLLGVALIVLTVGSRMALPVWLRLLTLIAGVIALASWAFFPSVVLVIWGIVIGVWLLATPAPVATPRA